MDNGLVLGFFDGVHKAHRTVIESAADYCGNIIVLTFKDSPAMYFNKTAEYILQRKDSVEKIRQIAKNYPDKNIEVIEQDFSGLANLSAHDYLKNIINLYHPKVIATGFNYTFGLNKSGNSEYLENHAKTFGYKYICTPTVKEGNEIISSSLIKKYLKDGNLEKVSKMLESNFLLEGEVLHGEKLGRTIGFPTANITYPQSLIKLPYGVYKGLVSAGDGENKLKAIVNWGTKPTFNNTAEPVVEAHILNFNGDLYGKNIKIEIIKKIRAEQKFHGAKELVTQIEKDIEECLKS